MTTTAATLARRSRRAALAQVVGGADDLDLLRKAIGGYALVYVLVRSPDLVARPGVASSWEPIGVLSVFDGGAFPRWVSALLVCATVSAGMAFVAGRRLPWSGPAFAGLLLVVLTHRLSFGKILHTEHLLMLDVAILGVAPLLGFGGGARRDSEGSSAGAVKPPASASRPHDANAHAVLRLLALVTVVSYVVAGVAKIRHGGVSWLGGEDLRHWVAFDNLRKIELGDRHSPLGGALTGVAWPWPIFAVASVAVELGAPLALAGRRAAQIWCVTAWTFHAGVLALMAILFPFPLSGIAFLPVLRYGYRRRR